MAKTRLNITLDESMKAYCQEKADEFGVSLSGFINVVLATYKQQQDGIKAMGNMEELIKMVETLVEQEAVKKNKKSR